MKVKASIERDETGHWVAEVPAFTLIDATECN